MNLYQIIKRPIITEKTQYMALEQSKFTFEVDRRANKAQVKRAIEEIYDVQVTSVNIAVMPAKAAKRWGRRRVVRQPAWKKAIVTLAEGDSIPLFEVG